MSSQSEGSTLTQWIINVGGGTDPSWTASVVRFCIAASGLWVLYEWNVSYGSLTHPARLVASAAAALFAGSLVVKIVKAAIDAYQRDERMTRAERHWNTLQKSERELISKFMSGKRRRLTLEETNPPIIEPLVDIGVLKDLHGHLAQSAPDGPGLYELSEGMWAYALSQWERDKFRTDEERDAESENLNEVVEKLRQREKSAKARVEQLQHELEAATRSEELRNAIAHGLLNPSDKPPLNSMLGMTPSSINPFAGESPVSVNSFLNPTSRSLSINELLNNNLGNDTATAPFRSSAQSPMTSGENAGGRPLSESTDQLPRANKRSDEGDDSDSEA